MPSVCRARLVIPRDSGSHHVGTHPVSTFLRRPGRKALTFRLYSGRKTCVHDLGDCHYDDDGHGDGFHDVDGALHEKASRRAALLAMSCMIAGTKQAFAATRPSATTTATIILRAASPEKAKAAFARAIGDDAEGPAVRFVDALNSSSSTTSDAFGGIVVATPNPPRARALAVGEGDRGVSRLNGERCAGDAYRGCAVATAGGIPVYFARGVAKQAAVARVILYTPDVARTAAFYRALGSAAASSKQTGVSPKAAEDPKESADLNERALLAYGNFAVELRRRPVSREQVLASRFDRMVLAVDDVGLRAAAVNQAGASTVVDPDGRNVDLVPVQ